MAAELDYLQQIGKKIVHFINERRELSWNLLFHSVDENIINFHSWQVPVYINQQWLKMKGVENSKSCT